MSASVLALFFGLSEIAGPLPSEKFCEARYLQADAHIDRLHEQARLIGVAMDFWCGDGEYNSGWGWVKGGARIGGGTAQHILGQRLEAVNKMIERAEEYKSFWWSMWWVVWLQSPRTSFTPDMIPEGILTWRGRAERIFGELAFEHAWLVPAVPPEQMRVE